jgi:hypothetical protein
MYSSSIGGSVPEEGKPWFVDATEEFQRYRLMLRNIWNSYVWSDPDLRDWDMVDQFNRLRPVLAESLLGEKLRRMLDVEENAPIASVVVPAQVGIGPRAGRTPIRISETLQTTGSRDWSQPPGTVGQRDMVMLFRDFFDWGLIDYRDFQYFLIEILASVRFPEVIGREALIEVRSARVLVFPGAVTEDELNRALDQFSIV